MRLRITITSVTEWETDEWEYEGLASHVGDHDAISCKLDEEDEKEESEKWSDEHLPYSFEREFPWSGEDDVDSDAIQTLCLEELENGPCYGDILKPEECEFEYEIINS